jgi:hypothetical protein
MDWLFHAQPVSDPWQHLLTVILIAGVMPVIILLHRRAQTNG